jgi:hypothetical protein
MPGKVREASLLDYPGCRLMSPYATARRSDLRILCELFHSEAGVVRNLISKTLKILVNQNSTVVSKSFEMEKQSGAVLKFYSRSEDIEILTSLESFSKGS